MALHCRLTDRKVTGDVLIRVASGDQPEYVNFACRQRVISCVIGQLQSKFCWDPSLSRVDGTDRIEQFPVYVSLEHVPSGTAFEGAQDLGVTAVCCENNDASLRKLSPNSLNCLEPIHLRHLKIHQGYVGSMRSEGLYGFSPIRCLCNQFQVRFCVH